MNETVRRFLPMVDFLEQILGKNSEIVLHDFSDPDHAIVDIRNGIVSGRKVGGVLPPIWHSRSCTTPSIATCRLLRATRGAVPAARRWSQRRTLSARMMRSSVCSASTPTSRPCAPSTPWRSSSWRASTRRRRAREPAPIEVESLSESTQELIDRSIAELLSARGLDVASLGQSDRVDVIRHLNGNGVFMLKGAVACAAAALGISEPSVYRYLQKVRKEG